MIFKEWEPIYRSILKDMDFDRRKDECSAFFLSKMLELRDVVGLDVLRNILRGKDVLVCGRAPSLNDDIRNVEPGRFVTIAADGATSILMRNGIIPDIIVTDLDGNMTDEARASDQGAIMVVHAHGDNMGALCEEVPKLKRIIGTTQSKPLRNVHNFGGFTDGDRCVFLADEMGAGTITLIGFDFNDPDVTPMKKKKLMWADKLIKLVMDRGSDNL